MSATGCPDPNALGTRLEGEAPEPAGGLPSGGGAWFWPGVLVLLVTLSLCGFLRAQTVQPDEGLVQGYAYDFRGHPLPREITTFGPLEDGYLKVEPEGLRVTLPRDQGDRPAVGFSLPVVVSGDFDITAAVEILSADQPAPDARSYGTGVLMSVNQAARVGRLLRARGEVATWDRWSVVDGQRKFLFGGAPCTGKTGRLRLKRTGTTLHFQWVPGTSGENFQEIHQCAFGDEDVTEVRLRFATDLGGKAGALDARLLDLKIRSSAPATGKVVVQQEPRETRSKKWVLTAGIMGLVFLVSLLLALGVRYARYKGATLSGDPAVRNQAPTATATTLSVRCTGCGNVLKGKADLAGKKVKCPQCGQMLIVPGNLPSS